MHADDAFERRGHDRAAAPRPGLLDAFAQGAPERVAQVAVTRRFEAGEIVFKEGDEGSTCYVVRSGRARAVIEHPDGRSITLAHFGPGDIFGEMAMLDGERRSATVESIEATDAIAIGSADMHRLLRRVCGHLGEADRGARATPA